MNLIPNNKLAASLCTFVALALAPPAAASAQEQEAMSPEQQYAYTCGHLGTDCGGEDSAQARKPREVRRTCRKSSRGSKTRARRSARRCGARRAGARR